MVYIHVSNVRDKAGKKVSIKGWVYRKRSGGNILFMVLRDHTGILQASIKKDNVDKISWKHAEDAQIESSVELTGTIKKDDRAPTGYELEATKMRVVGKAEAYPITEYQSTELLLDKRHLWLRSTKMVPIMKARSHIFKYTREFLDRLGFFEITPPLITSSGGETGADMFTLDYFGKEAYLTESSQLYAEAMIYSLEKVYSFAPSWRAEKSRTNKHLAEYWHLEPEMAYYNLNKTIALMEKLVSHISERLAKKSADVLETAAIDPTTLSKIKPPFKRMTYEEAIGVLNDMGSSVKWGDDLGVEEERLLTKDADRPIFIMYWPKELKPFYMPINPKDERTVMCVDMQAPKGHGEIIGGSERVWKIEEALARFKEVEKTKGVKFNMDNYSWYLDIIRYGGVPHSGFGMGMERLVKWLMNLDHIRDAIPFPRMMNRVSP